MTPLTQEQLAMYTKEAFRAIDRWDYVYVITAYHIELGYVGTKIGIAADPFNRVGQVQRSLNDVRIRCAITAAFLCPEADHIERVAHEKFDEQRVEGEWFYIPPEEAVRAVAELVIEYTKKTCKEIK